MPFDKIYALKSVLKAETRKDTKRTSMLTDKNYTKQGENL